jgi:hypothetical protein
MQWSLNWYDYILVYAVTYIPYVVLVVFIILGIRDIVKRKLHKSTIVVMIITLLLFILSKSLESVI